MLIEMHSHDLSVPTVRTHIENEFTHNTHAAHGVNRTC